MAQDEQQAHKDLRHLFGAAGRAHHAVNGCPNPGWARWYAEWMYGQLLPLIDSNPSVGTVENWLVRADARYQAEEPTGSWPSSYADWFLLWAAEGK